MQIEKAISYINVKGNIVEKARLAALLWDKLPPKAVLKKLVTLQKPDGGFCYWVRQTSNICDTVFVLQWFDDLKVYRGPIVDPACQFLLDRQKDDGGWDEVEEVEAFNPPEWMMPGRIDTRVWLTAYCAHILIRFGYAETEGTFCPTDFLLSHCDETGRLVGYLRATWIALPMLAFYPGSNSKPFHQALATIEANYNPNREGAYLAWMLHCFVDAGLSSDHPLVARCLDDLKKKQRSNGSWEPEEGEGEEHAVNATIAALRALKRYELI